MSFESARHRQQESSPTVEVTVIGTENAGPERLIVSDGVHQFAIEAHDPTSFRKGERIGFTKTRTILGKNAAYAGEIVREGPQQVVEEPEVITRSESKPIHTGLPVKFLKEKGQFTVSVEGKTVRIVNAPEVFVLPNDLVDIELIGNSRARITSVEYRSPTTVAGYVDQDRRQEDRSSRTFVVRVFGQRDRRVMHKFMFPADAIPNAEALYKSGRPILFDRVSKTPVDHPRVHERQNSYKEAKWVALTNMGVYQYDDERGRQMIEEANEVEILKRTLGVTSEDEKDWDAEMEDALAKRANDDVDAGRRSDFRGKVTLGIDPYESKDHDDVFSVEELSDGWTELGIHIADVGEFVKEGSAIDIEAEFRSTSMYLPDEVLRMLPSLISEHAASLRAGYTRLAFSFILDVKEDDDKGVIVRNLRFKPTVVRVSKNLTYDQAQEIIVSGKGEYVRELQRTHALIEAFRKRFKWRQPGEVVGEKSVDTHQLIADLMTLNTRAAGVAYERLKRSGHERIRLVQDVVSGVYRRHGLRDEHLQEEFTGMVERLGIMSPEEIKQSSTFNVIVRTARRRIERGYASPETTEEYYKEAYRLMEGATTGYATSETDHFAVGSLISRITSPIRRYADLMGQRTLKFLARIQERSLEDEDITDEEARALITEYLVEVIGLPLPSGIEELSLEELVDYIGAKADAHLARVLAHASVRENLSKRAENVTGAVQTATRIYREIFGRYWHRRSKRSGEGSPIKLTEGLVITVPKKTRPGMVYGETEISYRSNTELSRFVSGRVRDVGVAMQVAFRVPDGMPQPQAWCEAEGMEQCKLQIACSIVDVEVEQGRLILELSPGSSYQKPKRRKWKTKSRG